MENSNKNESFNLNYQIQTIGEITDPEDSNIDVYILFENGNKYFCTFFTLKNIETLLSSYKKTGENDNGSYFWSNSMILLEKISLEYMVKCINGLLVEGSFNDAFSYIGNNEDKNHYKDSLG